MNETTERHEVRESGPWRLQESPRPAAAVTRLNHLLAPAEDRPIMRIKASPTVAVTVLESDAAVVRFDDRRDAARAPEPADALLVIDIPEGPDPEEGPAGEAP